MASTNATTLTQRLAAAYFSGSFKCLLVSSVPSEADFDSFAFRNAIPNEITGTGYTAGGVAVTVTVGALDTTNNRIPITFTNLSPGWTGSTLSAVGAWVYKVIGSSATDELIQFVDFGGTVTSSSSNFNVTFSTPLYINR